MSAAAWTARRAKRDLRRGLWTRHVDRLRVGDLHRIGYTFRVVPMTEQMKAASDGVEQ